MAEGDGFIYNEFKFRLPEGVYNLASGGHTLPVTLHTGYTPDIDNHSLWADAGVSSTEYGTGAGYTAGGQNLAGQSMAKDNANNRGVFDGADVLWTGLGPLTPATPSHTILWNTTPVSPLDPLIAYWELGTTATNGGNYTLQWNALGIILFT